MWLKKHQDTILFIMIALMFSTVCMETDIYVPAFPDLRMFFSTTADAIQQILSLNFVGICLGSLIFGPLSDSYGRKKALQLGLGVFCVASWGCLFAPNFMVLLICRFIQGIGAAAPMVVSFAIILEKYEPQKVAQLCGGLNLFITGVMAVAPIVGSLLNNYFGWRAIFLLIAVLATASYLGSLFLVPETLEVKDRNPFSIPKIISNYGTVLSSFPYSAAACICYFLFAGLIVFVANLSFIFIEHLGISKSSYGFYQASAPGSFALFSFISIWVIGRLGTDKTKQMGLIITSIGAALLLLTAYVQPNAYLICSAMIIFTAGVTFAAPIYAMESANVYPEMRGIATGMSNALRHIIVAGIVAMGSYAFNGTIMPVAILIALLAVASGLLAIALAHRVKTLAPTTT